MERYGPALGAVAGWARQQDSWRGGLAGRCLQWEALEARTCEECTSGVLEGVDAIRWVLFCNWCFTPCNPCSSPSSRAERAFAHPSSSFDSQPQFARPPPPTFAHWLPWTPKTPTLLLQSMQAGYTFGSSAGVAPPPFTTVASAARRKHLPLRGNEHAHHPQAACPLPP